MSQSISRFSFLVSLFAVMTLSSLAAQAQLVSSQAGAIASATNPNKAPAPAPLAMSEDQKSKNDCIESKCALTYCWVKHPAVCVPPKDRAITAGAKAAQCSQNGCAEIEKPEAIAPCGTQGGGTCKTATAEAADPGFGDGNVSTKNASLTSSPAPSPTPTRSTAAKPAPAKTPSPAETAEAKKPAAESEAEKSNSANNSEGGNSPSNSGGQPSAAEQATCDAARSRADQYCGGSPPSGYSGSSSGGLNSYGNSLASGSAAAANASYQWGVQCTTAYTSCSSYCEGVDDSSASYCRGYSSKASQAARQTSQSVADNNAAAASGNSAGTGGGAPGSGSSPIDQLNALNDPNGCSLNPGSPVCQLCSRDPSHPSCNGGQMPETGFREVNARNNKLDDFNVGSINTGNPGYQGNADYGQQVAAGQARGIPNGGGQMLGGEGGARLDGGRGGMRAQSTASAADILQGERSGGFAGYGAQGPTNEFEERGRVGGARGGGRGPSGSPYDGMDLKRFLPGGLNDPGRQMGGATRSGDILGKGADLFKRVSERFQERCRLGRLFDCR